LLVYRLDIKRRYGGKLAVYQGELPEGMSQYSLPVNVKMSRSCSRNTSWEEEVFIALFYTVSKYFFMHVRVQIEWFFYGRDLG
jgi:hypothetical protein